MGDQLNLYAAHPDLSLSGKRAVYVRIFSLSVIFYAAVMLWGYTSVLPPIAKTIKQVLDYAVLAVCFLGMMSGRMKYRVQFLIIPLIYWLIYFFYRYQSSEVSPDTLNMLQLVFLGFLYPREMVWLFVVYRKTLIVVSCLGIIAYLAFFFFPALPHQVSTYYLDASDPDPNNFYVNYYFSVILNGIQGVRLCGLFDEPGRFGTQLALLLIVDNMRLSKKGNLVMFIACLMTLSVAAVFLMVMYVLLTSNKNPKIVLFFCIVALGFIFLLPLIMTDDSALNFFLGRFQFEDGQFAGDNRMNDEVRGLMRMQFSHMDTAIFGYGTGSLAAKGFTTLSFLMYVFMYGIVGTIVMFVPPIWVALKYCKMNRTALLYLFCYCVSLYQRPHLFTLSYFVLLFGGIFLLANKYDLHSKPIPLRHGREKCLGLYNAGL